MSAGFTPGPWEAEVHELSEGISAVVYDANGHMLADHLDEPTAHLIAAAPDGYDAGEQAIEALNAMMDAWFDYHDSHSLTQPVTGAAGNAFDKALAAREKLEAFIANARGEQS